MSRRELMLMLAVLALTAPMVAAPPAVPDTPASVDALLYARPFTLAEPAVFDWRAERPVYDRGLLLVITAPPAYLYPRQIAEPVLYVGDQTAMRLNVGYRSGRLVALIPGAVDLTRAPIWFGTPELPERVDDERLAAERRTAEAVGIVPFNSTEIAAALRLGGETLRADDIQGVLTAAAVLVREHAPDETSRVKSLGGGD